MGDAGIKSAIQGSNFPNPYEAVPSFVSGAMVKAGKGLLEGTLQAGTSAVSDKLLDLVGLGGKSAADKVNFFFQAEDGIRHLIVTGVQTCALPILRLNKRDNSGISPQILSLIPMIGPLHVSLNSRETLFQIYHFFFEMLYHNLFGENKILAQKPDRKSVV